MNPLALFRKVQSKLWLAAPPLYGLLHRDKQIFDCPVCDYHGPFVDIHPPTGIRRHAQCARCGALERHRLQYLVLQQVFAHMTPGNLRMLHFAPEKFFRGYFVEQVGSYETADLFKKNVDYRVDIQDLPIGDASYDLVYASHVLEHVPDDHKAIGEIRRILRPGGMAILPVPLVCEQTVEYETPNPRESYHVRAPGLDYFDRYRDVFSKVEVFASDSFPAKHQLFILTDRASYQVGDQLETRKDLNVDMVPVCYA